MSCGGCDNAPLSTFTLPPSSTPLSSSSPSLVQKTMSFAAAVVKYALGGFRHTQDLEYAARLEVCRGSESKPHCDRLSRDGEVCTACGCVLDIKARMPAEFCPLARWPSLDEVLRRAAETEKQRAATQQAEQVMEQAQPQPMAQPPDEQPIEQAQPEEAGPEEPRADAHLDRIIRVGEGVLAVDEVKEIV